MRIEIVKYFDKSRSRCKCYNSTHKKILSHARILFLIFWRATRNFRLIYGLAFTNNGIRKIVIETQDTNMRFSDKQKSRVETFFFVEIDAKSLMGFYSLLNLSTTLLTFVFLLRKICEHSQVGFICTPEQKLLVF